MKLNDVVRLRSDLTSRKMRVVAIQNDYARCIWYSESEKICGETYPIASLVTEGETVSIFFNTTSSRLS